MSELYSAYIEAFLRGLSAYARVEAAAGAHGAVQPPYITVSQRLEANGSPMFVGLAADAAVFFTLAGGYSGVSLEGMEELAVDAVSELFNVINGHFSSEMRARGHAVSIIDPPRHAYAAPLPQGAPLSHALRSPWGAMHLIAAPTEFLPA